MQTKKEMSLKLCETLEKLDPQAIIEKLQGKERVHTFLGYGLFGCDIDADEAIQHIQDHGAWKATEDFGGYIMDHHVVTVDQFGQVITLEITL